MKNLLRKVLNIFKRKKKKDPEKDYLIELQLAAVKESPDAYPLISNPTEEVTLAAIQSHPYVIQYIKNPSEKLQLAAIHESYHALDFIKYPTKTVILTALRINGEAIRYVPKSEQTEEMKLIALSTNRGSYQWIHRGNHSTRDW